MAGELLRGSHAEQRGDALAERACGVLADWDLTDSEGAGGGCAVYLPEESAGPGGVGEGSAVLREDGHLGVALYEGVLTVGGC